MTNQESKKMLKAKLECLKRETSGTDIDCNYRNCDECNLCYEQGTMGEQKEALGFAIKALEQIEIWNATTKDRQIIAPKGTFQKIWEDEQQPCEDCISREEALKVMCDNCPMYNCVTGCSSYRHIEKMPSVTPQQTRWIPCSERMPEVSDYYLIQHSRHICRDEMAVAYYSVEEAECDENYTWEFKPFADCKEVIAWMPLPKLYEPQESEEDNDTI